MSNQSNIMEIPFRMITQLYDGGSLYIEGVWLPCPTVTLFPPHFDNLLILECTLFVTSMMVTIRH